MNVKARNQRNHAKYRAMQRFGIALNRHQMRDLVRLIQTQKSPVSKILTHRVSTHVLYFGGTLVKVLYDKHRKTVVTFLYPSEAEIHEALRAMFPAMALTERG